MRYSGQGDYAGLALPSLTPGVKALLIINVGVFVVNAFASGGLIPLLGVSWPGLWEGFGLGLLRLVTYQFVHSFTDVGHILFNMLVLYFFGTFVEGMIGKERLIRLYLLSGIGGGILQVVLFPGGWVCVGASGACYGILLYGAMLAPRMRVIMILFPIELRWLVALLVGVGVYTLLLQLGGHVGAGVAQGGHVGGAASGFLIYKLERSSLRFLPLERFRRRRAERLSRGRQRRQEILDELLDKVHREGISSLSQAERRFLDKTSSELRKD